VLPNQTVQQHQLLAPPESWSAIQHRSAVLLLSGLLTNQERLVTSFYRDLRFVGARRSGPWSALVLEKFSR